MPEDSIHQPNDKLLKATFSSPENARAFFQNHLPPELAAALDWNSLALEPCSFIDPQFASSESDLLFHITLQKSDAFLYLLFEHQSSEDPRMALRLLSYILRIWDRFAQNHPPPAQLPAILPIVLAQGKRPWKTSTRLEDIIELPPSVAHILRPWQPTLVYHLLELIRIPYDAIAGTPEGILTLRALKAEPVDELLGDAVWDEALLFSISESALERILRYILNADVSVPQLKKRLGKIQTKPLQSKTMTLADRLREEGKLEGQMRAFRTSVLRALEIRHGSYPDGIREAVESTDDLQRLEALLDSAIRSDSLEAFSQEL
ncbi:MAG: Rpn family recombination-promoting nuclease/putative transposase [Proteobacteria bacterium]|nr:Rpn family recombination-promoting nuclease/putative transposase [Pseudomonadota bacterium]